MLNHRYPSEISVTQRVTSSWWSGRRVDNWTDQIGKSSKSNFGRFRHRSSPRHRPQSSKIFGLQSNASIFWGKFQFQSLHTIEGAMGPTQPTRISRTNIPPRLLLVLGEEIRAQVSLNLQWKKGAQRPEYTMRQKRKVSAHKVKTSKRTWKIGECYHHWCLPLNVHSILRYMLSMPTSF